MDRGACYWTGGLLKKIQKLNYWGLLNLFFGGPIFFDGEWKHHKLGNGSGNGCAVVVVVVVVERY